MTTTSQLHHRAPISSITLKAARDFLSDPEAGHAKEMACKKIAGFHLIKRVGTKGPQGTWRLRYTGATGKERVITIGKFTAMTPVQAAAIAHEHRTNVNTGIDPIAVITQRKAEQRRLEQIESARKFRTLEKYLDGPYTVHQSTKKDEGKHTLGIIRSGFKNFLTRDMDSLSKADIFEWQLSMYKNNYAHSTVQRAFGALKTMLRHAVENEFLECSPISSVRLNPAPINEQERLHSGEAVERRRMLTDDELAGIHLGIKLLAEEVRCERRNSRSHGKPYLQDFDKLAYPHWVIPFTLLAMHTGLRPGDIRTLTWQQLSIPFKRLTKTPSKTQHNPNPIQIRQTLNSTILAIMTDWNIQQGRPQTGLVFPSPDTGFELSKKAYIRKWKRLTELGGVEDLDFYSLRHHFISVLVSSGIPLLTVAHLAGHKSIAMIERHYGHLAPDQAADALSMLAQRLNRKDIKTSKQTS